MPIYLKLCKKKTMTIWNIKNSNKIIRSKVENNNIPQIQLKSPKANMTIFKGCKTIRL